MYVGVILKLHLKDFQLQLVFPMYVGVILSVISVRRFSFRVPHVCGGDPIYTSITDEQRKCSPCMWG